jgi:phage baseplate assembly protein gpV
MPDQKNPLKAIVSKSGIFVQFDDENKVFTIQTPNKNTVILSDKDHQVTVKDENNNSMVMSASGIVISSPKEITIKADQHITIQGTLGIKVEASGGDVATSGLNIKETADMQYSAQGGETAQINAGMEMTLKSAMIMIN